MVPSAPRRNGEARYSADPSLAPGGERVAPVVGDVNRTLTGLLALMGLVVGVYWSTVATIIDQWSVSSFRHSFMVPLIVLYILWRGRGDLAGVPWRASIPGAFALVLAVGAWIVSRAAFVQIAEHVALLLILHATILAVAGPTIYRRIAFPLWLLALALPIGTGVMPLLMESTAGIASGLLGMVGIPFHRVGMILTLPGGTFEVAEVCAGFNYLSSGLLISIFAAHLLFRSMVRRVLFVAAFGALMVLTNGIRAFVVMAIASMSEMRWMAGTDHIVFGWLLFAAVMLGMYFVGERYSDVRSERRPVS